MCGKSCLGPCWEGFLIAQVLRVLQASRDEAYFWATHAGAELDLMVVRGRQRLGFEIKRTDAPKLTPYMRTALADLKLTKLHVVQYPLHGGV
jgi:predicted AAA+ superfamily ATPase